MKLITVRELKPEDRGAYIEMAHNFYSSPAALEPIPDEYLKNTFEECLRSSVYAKAYILEYNGDVAGYALTAKTFSQEAGGYVRWIEELYIRQSYRSKGLGSSFLKYMEQTREKTEKRFRLEIEKGNIQAAGLYEKLGYKAFEYRQMIKTFG